MYRTDASLGCTISVWDGDVAARDVEQHLMRIAEDASWPPGRLHLTDLSTIRTAAIPDAQLVELLYEGTSLGDQLKLAVVVRDEFRADGDVRFMSGVKQLEGAMFADLNDACDYLKVDTKKVREIIRQLRTELDTGRS